MTSASPRPLAATALLTLAAMTWLGTAHADGSNTDSGADTDAAPPITPYRPSVSSPAQLPAPGQLEFELGGLRTRSSNSGSDGSTRRSSLPYLFKLAFSNEWGVLVGGDAHVWTNDDALGRAQGVGDTTVTLKRAWIVDDASAFGMELGAKLPTANDSIGSGRADYILNTIYSRDLGPVHMDANLNATRLGFAEPGSSHTQVGASTSFSMMLSQRWGLTGEVSGTHRSSHSSAGDGNGNENGLQFLSALTFSPSKRLTFDVGVARAVRPRPMATSVFAGVVVPLGRLW